MARPLLTPFKEWNGWHMDSVALGKLLLPAMQFLPDRVSNLKHAVLCTTEGFNVCSMGVNEEQIGKLAALASSIFAVGEATTAILHDRPAALDLLSFESGGLQIVGQKINHVKQPLILMASANAPLGVLIMGVKHTSTLIETTLAKSG